MIPPPRPPAEELPIDAPAPLVTVRRIVKLDRPTSLVELDDVPELGDRHTLVAPVELVVDRIAEYRRDGRTVFDVTYVEAEGSS